MGKPHFCNSVGTLCSESPPQKECGHRDGGSASIGALPRALHRDDLRSARDAVPWELAPGESWS